MGLWVRGDVSRQPCPLPGCPFVYSGICCQLKYSLPGYRAQSYLQTFSKGTQGPGLVVQTCMQSQLFGKLRQEDQKKMQGLPDLQRKSKENLGSLMRSHAKMKIINLKNYNKKKSEGVTWW